MSYIVSAGGVLVPAKTVTTGAVLSPIPGIGVKLAATTYYFPFGSNEAVEQVVQIAHPAGIAYTATIEACALPQVNASMVSFGNPQGVSDIDVTDGQWIQFNPAADSNLYSIIAKTDTPTACTIVATSGAAGGAIISLRHTAIWRWRVKLVVGTAGTVQVATLGKY